MYTMKNIKKYNNNIILAEDFGQEVIVLGKGIGFQAVQGMDVDINLVEKIFIPQESASIGRFADTLSGLSYEYVLLASKIVDYGKEKLKVRLNPSIVVALADHFSVVLQYPAKISTQTPLQFDIRYIYPDEFQTGIEALEIIKRERDINLPEAEALNIALHFINAEFESSNMPVTFKIVTITGDILRIVEQYYKIILDKETLVFMRFINHVRSMVIEYVTAPQNVKSSKADDELYKLALSRLEGVAECCSRISDHLYKKYGLELHKNDAALLAIYITKIMEGIEDRELKS